MAVRLVDNEPLASYFFVRNTYFLPLQHSTIPLLRSRCLVQTAEEAGSLKFFTQTQIRNLFRFHLRRFGIEPVLGH